MIRARPHPPPHQHKEGRKARHTTLNIPASGSREKLLLVVVVAASHERQVLAHHLNYLPHV